MSFTRYMGVGEFLWIGDIKVMIIGINGKKIRVLVDAPAKFTIQTTFKKPESGVESK